MEKSAPFLLALLLLGEEMTELRRWWGGMYTAPYEEGGRSFIVGEGSEGFRVWEPKCEEDGRNWGEEERKRREEEGMHGGNNSAVRKILVQEINLIETNMAQVLKH